MQPFWKVALVAGAFVLAVGLVFVLAFTGHRPVSAAHVHALGVHAQTSGENLDWSNSRFRCIDCHSNHTHEVLMPHPLRPECDTCHSGTPTSVGCPSCHSIHDIDYPHETYPTCGECHEESEGVAPAQVETSATGYVFYLFNRRDVFLSDDSAIDKYEE